MPDELTADTHGGYNSHYFWMEKVFNRLMSQGRKPSHFLGKRPNKQENRSAQPERSTGKKCCQPGKNRFARKERITPVAADIGRDRSRVWDWIANGVLQLN
jgi:hypothetical protein